MVELKFRDHDRDIIRILTLNRTMVELKYDQAGAGGGPAGRLIAQWLN